MGTQKKEAVESRPNEIKIRCNRRTGEKRRVHNFRLNLATSDKLRKLATEQRVSQGAIIEHLVAQAK